MSPNTPNQGQNEQPIDGVNRRDVLKGAALGAFMVGAPLVYANKEKIGRLFGARERRESVRYNERQMNLHVQASQKQWSSAESLLNEEEESCIDGRCGSCVACTPGGDIGDLAMQVAATEKVSGRRFNRQQVEGIFTRNLEHHHGKFYMHSDEHALEHLAHALHVDLAEAQALIRNPGRRRDEVERALLNPDNVGCGHIKLMLKNQGNAYPEMRPEMLQDLMRAYFHKQWENPEATDYVLLEGNHEEGAVALVKVRGKADKQTMLPKIQPKVVVNGKESSVFVIHPQLEELSTQRSVNLAPEVMDVPKINRGELLLEQNRLRQAYLAASAGALASDKPIYNVEFDAENQDRDPVIRPA